MGVGVGVGGREKAGAHAACGGWTGGWGGGCHSGTPAFADLSPARALRIQVDALLHVAGRAKAAGARARPPHLRLKTAALAARRPAAALHVRIGTARRHDACARCAREPRPAQLSLLQRLSPPLRQRLGLSAEAARQGTRLEHGGSAACAKTEGCPVGAFGAPVAAARGHHHAMAAQVARSRAAQPHRLGVALAVADGNPLRAVRRDVHTSLDRRSEEAEQHRHRAAQGRGPTTPREWATVLAPGLEGPQNG